MNNKNKKIFFRINSDHKTGMGHLFRMMVLAQMFIENNWKVRFITKGNRESIRILKEKGLWEDRQIDFLG